MPAVLLESGSWKKGLSHDLQGRLHHRFAVVDLH